MGSGGRPPSAELFYKGQALDAPELEEGTTTEGSSRSGSPPCAPCLEDLEADSKLEEEEETPPTFEVSVDKDAESAIHALLALQREPSPTAESSRPPSPDRASA